MDLRRIDVHAATVFHSVQGRTTWKSRTNMATVLDGAGMPRTMCKTSREHACSPCNRPRYAAMCFTSQPASMRGTLNPKSIPQPGHTTHSLDKAAPEVARDLHVVGAASWEHRGVLQRPPHDHDGVVQGAVGLVQELLAAAAQNEGRRLGALAPCEQVVALRAHLEVGTEHPSAIFTSSAPSTAWRLRSTSHVKPHLTGSRLPNTIAGAQGMSPVVQLPC